MSRRPRSLFTTFWNLLTRRDAVEHDLDAEVRGYADELVARHIRQGLHPAEARRRVLAQMGSIESVKERVRETRSGWTLEAMLFGVTAGDPLTLATVAMLFGCVAGIASVIPALGALRVDPVGCCAPTSSRMSERMRHLDRYAARNAIVYSLRAA